MSLLKKTGRVVGVLGVAGGLALASVLAVSPAYAADDFTVDSHRSSVGSFAQAALTVLSAQQGNQTVAGTGTPGTTINVSYNNNVGIDHCEVASNPPSSVVIDTDGSWSLDLSLSIPASASFCGYSLEFSDATSSEWVVFQIFPFEITSPVSGETVVSPSGELTVTGTTLAELAGLTVKLVASGGAEVETTVQSDGTWSATLQGVPNGPQTITASILSSTINPADAEYYEMAAVDLTVTDSDAGVPIIAPEQSISTEVQQTPPEEPADTPEEPEVPRDEEGIPPAEIDLHIERAKSTSVQTSVTVSRSTPDPIMLGAGAIGLLGGAGAVTANLFLRARP